MTPPGSEIKAMFWVQSRIFSSSLLKNCWLASARLHRSRSSLRCCTNVPTLSARTCIAFRNSTSLLSPPLPPKSSTQVTVSPMGSVRHDLPLILKIDVCYLDTFLSPYTSCRIWNMQLVEKYTHSWQWWSKHMYFHPRVSMLHIWTESFNNIKVFNR